jgi:hypothetical protein
MILLGRSVRLEQRMSTPRSTTVLVPLLSVLFALIVGGIFLAATGYSPLGTYGKLLDNGYTSFYGITTYLYGLGRRIRLSHELVQHRPRRPVVLGHDRRCVGGHCTC